MLTVRWVLGLGAFVLLGVLASLVAHRFTVATIIFLLLLPPLSLVLPFALSQGARNFSALRKQLTWWHALWLLVFLSGLNFRRRDLQAISQGPVDVWAAYRISLVSITALVLLVRLVFRKTEWTRSLFRGLIGALAIYSLVCAASTLWSVYPAWTLYKSLEYLVDVALIAAVLATVRSGQTYKSLFNWTWMLLGGLLVTFWVEAVVWPEEAWVPTNGLLRVRLMGVVPVLDQNTVGEYAAYLAIVALSRLHFSTCRGERAYYRVVFAFGLITLFFSQTRVAIAGFLVAALLVLFFCKRTRLFSFLVALGILILTVAVLLSTTSVGNFLWAFWSRGETPEMLQNLSGRLTTWQLAWKIFLERPLMGYGAYAGGRFVVVAKQQADPLGAGVLNSYVEVIVGTGIWALPPLLLALAGSWWFLVKSLSKFSHSCLERQLAVEAVGILAIITARSFFTDLLVWHAPLAFLLVLGYAELLRRQRKREIPTRWQDDRTPLLN
jgi:O-antigen ligase